MHGVDNYVTQLLDEVIAQKWKKLTLWPGQLPLLMKDTGQAYLTSAENCPSMDELESDLDAIGLGYISELEMNIRYYFYKSEKRLRKYRFEVIHERLNLYQKDKETTLYVSFRLTSKSERWCPEDDTVS